MWFILEQQWEQQCHLLHTNSVWSWYLCNSKGIIKHLTTHRLLAYSADDPPVQWAIQPQ